MGAGSLATTLDAVRSWKALGAAAVTLLVVGLTVPVAAHPESGSRSVEFGIDAARMIEDVARSAIARATLPQAVSYTPCAFGSAAGYPCDAVDLLAHLPLPSIGGGEGNDIWGWTDARSGREFALVGRSTGTSFVEVTDPVNPVYVGTLPAHTTESIWRDIKVYGDYAYIVSEANGSGLQYFDLSRLLGVSDPPIMFEETGQLDGFSNAHNLAIDEETGFAYAVGSNHCSGGLYMIDLSKPSDPTFAGCYSADGYTHDAQCVVYRGPDADHRGDELCFASNEDTLTIVDVTDKAHPIQLARKTYPGAAYTHQGWLTEDHKYFLLDDEADEMASGSKTTTYIWDVRDVDHPVVLDSHRSWVSAIDHNQYVSGGHTYQANYTAGLRVLTLKGVKGGDLTEVGYFDVDPSSSAAVFAGSWSVYPFFASGVVVVNSIEQGLFVLYPTGARKARAVVDLDDRSKALEGSAWRARAKVNVVDGDGDPIEGARVKVAFSTGQHRSCVTNPAGRCFVKIKVSAAGHVRMRVRTIVDDPAFYTPWANTDRDGGTNGTKVRLDRV
jgi:choice-of-anchor B domain-containing protein